MMAIIASNIFSLLITFKKNTASEYTRNFEY